MIGLIGGTLRALGSRRAWALAWLAVLGIALLQTRDIWIGPSGRLAAVAELMLYWGCWLLFPGCVLLGLNVPRHAIMRRPWRMLRSLCGLLLCLLLIWGRFIEKNQLHERETDLALGCGVRVALISDLHIGLFTGTGQLEALVQRLNQLNVDAVLVAGDWTYQPELDLRKAFAPIAQLRLKPYAVLGNHDQGSSGSAEITEPLREALSSLGVRLIDGQRVPLGRCELEGLGDYLAGAASRDMAALARSAEATPPAGDVRRVMLTHEPETVLLMPRGYAVVSLAGHTHGGQISIPWLTRPLWPRLMPNGWMDGFYQLRRTKLFVTTGIGTDHLPLRIGMPPVIDILTL